MVVYAGNCTELAGEFQAVLDKCPSGMAKRWLVLRVCSSPSLYCAKLCDIALLLFFGSCGVSVVGFGDLAIAMASFVA